MLKLKGKITISRRSGDTINIEIIDDGSHCTAAEFTMTLADFALALTNMGHVDGELCFNDSGVIGKIHEHKEEIVNLPAPSYRVTPEQVRQSVAVHEVDGWRGDDRDATNHYRHVRGSENSYRVTYRRYVERKDGSQ